jgi:glycosyltransferase involved in cell wall biosynthesis
MDKHISIIGTAGIPANYGGLETCAEQLVTHQSEKIIYTVYCSSNSYTNQLSHFKNSNLRYVPINANGWQSIIYDYITIMMAVYRGDTLLIMGVSGCSLLPFIKLLFKNKVIVNIDGLEWKRDKWNRLAKFILKTSEYFAVKYADCIVSDNKHIQNYVTENYSRESALIEYGGDNSLVISSIDNENFKELVPFDEYSVFTCRIEPENNIHLILEAFSKNKGTNLVGIGNWKNSDYGKNLLTRYSENDNIILLDYISDQDLLNAIKQNSYLYIHGHSAGGTNPSLVEAMFLGLPIIAYDVPYNRETTENRALYFSSDTELQKLLAHLNRDSIQIISDAMKGIAEKRYRWEIIVSKYEALY